MNQVATTHATQSARAQAAQSRRTQGFTLLLGGASWQWSRHKMRSNRDVPATSFAGIIRQRHRRCRRRRHCHHHSDDDDDDDEMMMTAIVIIITTTTTITTIGTRTTHAHFTRTHAHTSTISGWAELDGWCASHKHSQQPARHTSIPFPSLPLLPCP